MLRKIVRRPQLLKGPVPNDLKNILRYGLRAPIAHEPVWIDPRAIRRCLPHPTEVGLAPAHPEYQALVENWSRARNRVGHVMGTEFDALRLFPLDAMRKISSCLDHWQRGASWEESGAIDNLLFKIGSTGRAQSGCLTREDVLRRYQRLDEVYRQVRGEGRLRSKARRAGGFRREIDGVQIHLGMDGELIFGEHGTHRLAMALALGLSRIPVSLGFVHESALELLPALRSPEAEAGREPALAT